MLRSLTALALLATAALGTTAHAQDWNRRISDVRIVHPPGTPPGTWKITASLDVQLTDGVPVPSSLGCDLLFELNGTVIGTTPVPLDTLNGPSCSVGGICTPGACDGLRNGGINIAGFCGYFYTHVGPLPVCGCLTSVGTFDFGPSSSDLRRSDVITVTLVPEPGSLAEIDTTDDSVDVPVDSSPIGDVFCSGDSTSPTPCPCGNSGTSGHGCANSQNAAGAVLAATGWTGVDPLTGTDSVTLHGSGMPATSSAIYLKSDTSNPAGSVFGDGVSCLTGSIIRLRTKINVGGASQFPEPGDPSVSVRGGTPPGSGLTGHYAAYYRNAAAAFCPPATFNITNAVSITW